LRDIPSVAIEDRGGIVEQLAHDGGTAGAPAVTSISAAAAASALWMISSSIGGIVFI
jgi:hypothetical protein